jgi:hypothetical protein
MYFQFTRVEEKVVAQEQREGSAPSFADHAIETVSMDLHLLRCSFETVNADVTTSISTPKILSPGWK